VTACRTAGGSAKIGGMKTATQGVEKPKRRTMVTTALEYISLLRCPECKRPRNLAYCNMGHRRLATVITCTHEGWCPIGKRITELRAKPEWHKHVYH
jgi:hypothetical protein